MATPVVANSVPTSELKEMKLTDAPSAPASTFDPKSIGNDEKPSVMPEGPSGPAKKPVADPVPTCKPASPAQLTSEQQSKYDSLLSTVTSWPSIPDKSTKNASSSPLTDSDRMWLTRECLLRYLRATKWDLPSATRRLQETLTWRREYGTETFTATHISPENETGKMIIFGFDKEGRPCIYMHPNKQNTKTYDRQVQHLVFMLERAIELMPPGQESLALVINFKDSTAGSNPSVSTGKQVLSILQNHYPERLGRALVNNLPWFVTAFIKLVTPFIDPVTKTKLKFNEPLPDHVPAVQLLKSSGGDVEFVYDHDVYWPTLNELCDQRRKDLTERWEKAGKRIGESEVYLKGGGEGSVGGVAEPELGKEVKGPVEGVQGEAAKPEEAGKTVED